MTLALKYKARANYYIDIEQAIKKGEKKFEPGILALANRNILYVDEINTALSMSANPNFDQVSIQIQDRVQKFIKRENGRTPVIMPIIVTTK